MTHTDDAAREAARTRTGRFGQQQHSAPEVGIPAEASKSEERFPLGQTVVVVENKKLSEAVVTRVGRVNVGIQIHGREVSFDKTTGDEKRHANAIGWARVIRTLDEQAAEVQREADVAELRSLGLEGTTGNYGMTRYTPETVRRILDIVRAEQD